MDLNTRKPKPSLRSSLCIPKMTAENKSSGSSKTSGPQVKTLPKPMLRGRSKSVADLRTLTNKPFSTPIKPLKQTEKPIALKKNDEENKSKVVNAKIPDWDYKSRFQELQRRFTALQEDLKQVKPKIANLPALEAEVETLRKQNKELQQKAATHESLCKENYMIKNKISQLQASAKQLKADRDSLQEKVESMVQEENRLKTKLESTETTLIEFKQKYTDLENIHICTGQTLASLEQRLKALLAKMQDDNSP